MPGDEEFALTVYQALRVRSGLAPGEVGRATGLDAGQVGRGLARLRLLGLVQEGAAGRLEPVEPDAALARTMETYDATAAEQARSATALRQLAQSLMTVYRPAVARESSQVDVEYISGRRHKDRTLHDLNASTHESCDSLHPGPMPPMHVLENSLRQDADLITRGVRVRALYPQSVLQTSKYARYVQDMTDLGAEVRLVDHAAFDLLIFDQVIACVPADPHNPAASIIVIRGSALIKAYVAVFEDYWLRAVPFQRAPSGAGDTELTPQERVVIRLMAGGLSDDQIARRMGVHRRTVQRAVAKMMDRLGATSRFEAGLRLARDPEFARFVRPSGRALEV